MRINKNCFIVLVLKLYIVIISEGFRYYIRIVETELMSYQP